MTAVPESSAAARRPDDDAEIPDPTTAARLAWLVKSSRGPAPHPRRHLLLLRFTLVNMVAGAVLAALALQGHVTAAFAADATGLVGVICAAFVFGLGLCALRVFEVSRETERARQFDPLCASRAADYVADVRGREIGERALAGSLLRMTLTDRIVPVRHVANALVLLGLIGTVVGFIIALSGVDPAAVADVARISPMVGKLITGMSVALYTTLAGAVLHLWLMVNYQLLTSGTVELIETIVRLGERHAHA